MKKVISIILSIVMITVLFTSCSGSDKPIDLIYPFGGNVNSFDPQVASTSDEFLIIENCFEGLVRSDDEGNIIPGCASSWEITNGGLTYTFHIQQGLNWHIYKSVKEKLGDDYNPEITANDFVFALQRAADINTNAPLFSTISSIVNATQIHSGLKDPTTLGVSALDDYTLRIQLNTPDKDFLNTMSTAIAMPCNKQFFESTKGRYGLKLEYTLFNGQFIVTNILDTSYILKNANSFKVPKDKPELEKLRHTYHGPNPAKATDLTLKIVDSETSLAQDLIDGYYDAAYLRGFEGEEVGKKRGIELVPYVNTTWSLVMNANSDGILGYPNARHAISIAHSEIDYDEFTYLKKASGIIPPTCTVNEIPYTEQAPATVSALDQEKAISLWKTAVKGSSIYNTEITLIAPENMKEVAKQILQGIQKSLSAISNVNDKKSSFTITLETMSESELKSKVYSGDYDIALYPFQANSSSPVSFLQTFSKTNLTGFDSDSFEVALNKAQASSSNNIIANCQKCEKKLIDSYCYVPLFYETSYYGTAKGVENVDFHPGTGRVSFVQTTR